MAGINDNAEELKILLAKCTLRDANALKRLYSLTSSKLYAVILRMVHRDDIAEDILQESYINIWTYAERYRENKSAPMTWMTRIVRNKTIDWLRCQPANLIQSSDINLDTEQVIDHTNYFEENKDLLDCLDKLEEKPKNALLQVYYKGLTHQELAKRTGNALGTIKSWIRRSLPLLKRCLES